MNKVKVIISNTQKKVKVPTGIRLLIRRCCHAVLQLEGFDGSAEVSVRFVDNEEIRKLNKRFRNLDKETDVLSFPLYGSAMEAAEDTADEETAPLGDIVISLEKASEQANEYGHGFQRETAFLCVHSVLHLLGYDHETGEEDEKEMFFKQDEIMELLGITR